MLEIFNRKVVSTNLVSFKWRKKKLEKLVKSSSKKEEKIEETKKVNPFIRYRNGGDGFIAWCEDNVNLAVYKEGSSVPTWVPMREMPDQINPETGRSYKMMWETQKGILREALKMKDGRFIYRLIIFCWMRGEGKCERKGSKVLMFNGDVRKVEDIEVGDLLMGDDNTPRKVLSLVNGKEEMFKVTPNRGNSLVVTADHVLSLKKRTNIKTRNGEKRRERGHDEIVDISVRDFMSESKNFKNKHMLFKVPIDWPKQNVTIDPYFLGIWLGDGHSTSASITTMDSEVAEYIHDFAKSRKLEVTVKQKITKTEGKEEVSKAKTYNIVRKSGKQQNSVLEDLRKNNLLSNKHIPKEYKINSREVRLQILAGILDADGHKNRNSFEITFKRKELANDVAFIARSLGFYVHKSKVTKGIKNTGFSSQYYRLGISGDCSVIPVRVERRKCTKRKDGWKDPLVSTIKSVESVGEQEYFGFMLDGNGRYVKGDFTVTHNSLIACLVQLWKFFCFPRQQIMLGANSKDQVKFVHYDIMKEIILNSPNLLKIIGAKNLQEKEMRLVDNKKRVVSMVRSISSFSGIVSNITGYTFSEIFDMKNPKFFVQLDGSIRNMPNAMGVIDSTVSEKTHILYQLYMNSLKEKDSGSVYFSYRCSPKGIHEDFFNPQMTQKQLDDYQSKFPPAEFARYFKNLWDSGVRRVFTDAQLKAMHYLRFNNSTFLESQNQIIPFFTAIEEKTREIEQRKNNGLEYSDTEIIELNKLPDSALYAMSNIYRLDNSIYFCEMASLSDLIVLEDIFDTHWCVGVGIDRADPLKGKVDFNDLGKTKKTTGARTMIVYVAKGLPGSRSDSRKYLDPDSVNKYVYVILGVKHANTSTIEEIKDEINLADSEYGGIDAICSERWGMFDIITWCDEKGVDIELISPTNDKQKEGFSELYLLVASGRIKVAPIGYAGSRGKDILMEEMSILESDADKVWYGSPEKNKSDGVQDDTCFALVWCIYGLRFKSVEDMRPRVGQGFMGQFIQQKDLVGKY